MPKLELDLNEEETALLVAALDRTYPIGGGSKEFTFYRKVLAAMPTEGFPSTEDIQKVHHRMWEIMLENLIEQYEGSRLNVAEFIVKELRRLALGED